MATKKFKCELCGYIHEGDKAPASCPKCAAPADAFTEIVEAGAEAPAKKKGLDTSSNTYTIIYASVMVIIVAFLLAFISSVLKPTQDANVENDTKGQILTSLNIDIKASGFNVADEFKNVQDMLWNGTELVPYEGKFLSSYGSAIKAGELHVFVAQAEGETKYVLPVTGRGLWGGLWGYIALNADKKTVYGTYFYHESETAGLGARIGERWFQEQFNGKPVFAGENTEAVALKVVKAGASKAENEIDGVTGATLTSDGVSAMVQDGLSVYLSFINN
jgi:Na+-transporting NADH:ubiquinone oxidoreductase subunit C